MKATVVQTNFTSGELSPRMLGRIDIERQRNGAEEIKNGLPLIHGGIRNVPMLRYNAAAKNSDRVCRLIRFEFSKTEANMLEFGHQYIRFFNQDRTQVMDGGNPYEIATVYDEDELFEIEYVGGADTIFLFHPNHPIQWLRRFNNTYWTIEDAPLDPAPFAEIGHRENTTLTLSSAAVGSGVTFTAGADSFKSADVGRQITAGGGIATITAFTSVTVVTCEITSAFASTSAAAYEWRIEGTQQTTCTPGTGYDTLGSSINLTLAAAGWRTDDVGKYVDINGGQCRITSRTSTTVAVATVTKVLVSNVAAQANAWVLKGAIWNSIDGYPRAGTFFQQRLLAGGSPNYPHSISGSVIGNYLNFELGVNDDEAFLYTLDATEYNPILHMKTIKDRVVALTSGNEYVLTGGVEAPLTPTNVQIENPTNFGSSDVRPIRVDNELMFINRTSKKLRALGYRFESDSFIGPDLTKLAEHITGNGVTDFAYQQEPESILWATREDGALVTCTIDRDEGVLAYARQITDGEFESVEAMPNGDVDEVWVAVKRTIDGNTVRYIESFDESTNYSMHSSISDTDSAKSTWSGLDHLEGESVEVVDGDGVYMGDFAVSSGNITLPREVTTIYAGLAANAYIKCLSPEMITQQGSAQGNHMRINKTTLRMLESVCVEINGTYVDLRKFGSNLLNQPAPTFTGDISSTDIGWDTSINTIVGQPNPLPFHLLALIMDVTVNQ